MLLLAPAIYMLQVYDRVLTSRNETTLVMLTLLVAGLLALEAVLEFVRSRVMIRVGASLDMKLGATVFDAALARHLAARGDGPAQALADLAALRQFLTGRGVFAFFDAPWTPLYLLVIFLLHPWLGVFATGAALVLLALAYVNERLTAPAFAEAGREAAAANAYAAKQLRNAEVIGALGMLRDLRERWFTRQARSLALQAKATDRAGAVGAVSRFARIFLQSVVLGFGALLVLGNELSAGGMIAASILLGRALAPVDLAIGTWRSFVAARAAFARLSDLLASYAAPGQALALPRPRGEVTAEDLALAPPQGGAPILRGVAFNVPAGTLVAIVGPSAAGKSTLARALVGVWKPLAGAVRLDGADVSTWERQELGPWLGYLPQDVELFEGTIAENIARFGTLDAERIVQAAQRAGVHELVLHLPQGYETPVGEGGMALSGGQRQRIALARALYGDPALLVLDEPNANLDDAGDAALLAALRTLKEEKRTAFVVTHRVNVLALADAVMVLAGGTMQAYGPRDSVLKVRASKPAHAAA